MLQAIVLGLIQGLTEFLPVSSSGHLVVVPYLLSWPQPSLAFGVALHFGTLLAVIVYFAGDLWYLATRSLALGGDPAERSHARRTVLLLAVASVPAAIVGLTLEATFEDLFARPRAVALFLLVTGALLWSAEHIRRRRVARELSVAPSKLTEVQARRDPGRDEGTTSVTDSLVIGVAQALAIVPGISRAGSTIAAGMVRGLSRQGAARFSFLMSIPVIAGASILELPALFSGELGTGPYATPQILVSVVVATASGYWAIRYLLRLVATDDLTGFARYVVIFGALTFFATLWIGTPAT